MAEVIDVPNGFAVKLTQGRYPEYAGRDGYWTRSPENVTPFAVRETAQEVADDLNGD